MNEELDNKGDEVIATVTYKLHVMLSLYPGLGDGGSSLALLFNLKPTASDFLELLGSVADKLKLSGGVSDI